VGGPLFQLLLRAHLADDALMLVRQRALIVALFAWLPLLVLSSLEGHLLAWISQTRVGWGGEPVRHEAKQWRLEACWLAT